MKNITMMQNTFGTQMKLGSRQVDDQVQKFWQNEVHIKFITLYLGPENGWLLIVLSMQLEKPYHDSISFKEIGCVKITWNFVKQGHVWLCKQRLGWQVFFSRNDYHFSRSRYKVGFIKHGFHVTLEAIKQAK